MKNENTAYVSEELKKFPAQILHMCILPAFLITFILSYTPFGSIGFLDAGRDRHAFDITIITAICLLIIGGLRVAFYFIFRRRSLKKELYLAWCLGEILIVALFAALFMTLVYKGEFSYFHVLGKCFALLGLTLVFPYLILYLAVTLHGARDSETDVAHDAPLIRFHDESKKLKFVIAAPAVLYIEAEENYVRIHYVENGRTGSYVLRSTMKRVEEVCVKHGLVRCHRSYLVNPEHIKMLRKDKDGLIVAELDSQTQSIPVSKTYYDKVLGLLV